jgi:DnaJ-class molecular chaperone
MAGDLYVRITVKKHDVYERKGADLFINKKISLLEALIGFNFKIRHLNENDLIISTAPGEIISHEQVKCIKNKGLPYFKDSFSYGNLYVKFEVEMPAKGSLK